MAPFAPSSSLDSTLKDRVVVLTGGSNGIGAAVVRLLHSFGATIIFGDLDDKAASSLISSLPGTSPPPTFISTNVTSYEANLNLFRVAVEKYGRVDHAISAAGIFDSGPWFAPTLTLEDVMTPPDTSTLDVNLIGLAYFVHIACAYLRCTPAAAETPTKSIILTSSAAGFKGTPSAALYSASKHAILGLMRSLRFGLLETHGLRINSVCPDATDTQMTQVLIPFWRNAGMPINSSEDVARVMAALMGGKEETHGKAVVVQGGKGWEVEEELLRVEPQFLGEEFSQNLRLTEKLMTERIKDLAKAIEKKASSKDS